MSKYKLVCVLIVLPVFLCGCKSPEDAEAYYEEGIDHSDAGRYAEAIVAYKKVIAIEPDDSEAHIEIGVAYSSLGKYMEAIAACKKFIAIKPNDAGVYYFLGNCHYLLPA